VTPPASRRATDREIVRLAVPALGALAAEPLYVLVDTAIVGHLGTPPLAALAIAATLLTSSVTLFNFLAYGTTAQVARAHGAGREALAGRLGAQALWLSLGLGAALALACVLLARPAVAAMGGEGEVAEMAVLYLRISALGLPCALVALAAQGFLRGLSELRRPLKIVVAANVVNVGLEVLFVYGFGWGIAGSASGTVIAQAGMGAAFVVEILRRTGPDRRPSLALARPLARMGGDIAVRTAALVLAFTLAGAVVARTGAASLAAHQIAFQLFVFLALVLDAIAIAGQVIVGRALGAGDPAGARATARRMIGWSVGVGSLFALGLLAVGSIVPPLFSPDPAVHERAAALWPLFALMQPVGGAVFALDGILIGAGDARFLKWSMLFAAGGVFAPIAALSLVLGWGLVGVWWGLNALMLARVATLGARFRGGRWAVAGATA
jgi:putative MATE family efflux protein